MELEFEPHPLLRSPHLQTVLSSRLARLRDGVGAALAAGAQQVRIPCRDGVVLQALVNRPAGAPAAGTLPQTPLVVVIHGWLGCADSPYVRRASAALNRAGFTVARLMLRDHGGTAHLNEELFNAARIDEVADAVNWLAEHHGGGACGLLGYSLGGNFVLRLAGHRHTSPRFRTALAVCPVLDPKAAVEALDRGWVGYQRYFLGKWRRAFAEKQAAFPDRYDFAEARRLSLVATLTDYFVSRHTPYRDADDYYARYTLDRDFLANLKMPVRVLATEDDPVLPAEHARALLGASGDAEVVTLVPYGGHCGFIEDLRLRTALDAWLSRFFADRLAAG